MGTTTTPITGAYEAAMLVLVYDPQPTPPGRPDDFDRLVERFGYDVASRAWRAACTELDRLSEGQDCPRCGEHTHPEDMTDGPDAGTEWAGVCLLCFDAATRR